MKKIDYYGYLFILPFFIVFITFTIYPIILTFYYSFTSYSGMGSPEFIGMDNYARLVTDTYFYRAFFNTIYIWGINFFFQIAIALLLAVLFSDLRLRLKGLGFFRAVFYLPNLITIASVALLFGILLGWHHGTINHLLLDLGLINQPINWLNNPTTARWSVALIGAWMWFGHTFIILMAGISGISRDYFEAALIDGANRWQTFTKVTIPLLKPILLYVLITSLIGGLQIFDLPMLITDGMGAPQGSLNTMVLYLYNQAFRFNNYGYAAAVAYGLFLITVMFSVITFKSMYRKSAKEG
ncbi:carbohydrate ABC transporter permease [Evansella cellulosilytica]|uniref:Binding-protein-dependent transport systems inner membrane component n=1 Tax=Evansella cellulosilytica (strain ATCC 21833 / DSM 2522 / FERM P-1141 / JCM 9156 / N-4) TaxID=649639 RepID=E6TZA7_EVAC2|nr:sugar ABC transporter permease [Evansella cellulosilytica]ADU28969.1 binding-protein-dependent transport systems inner membrane component [Evansella cellulosilytica DSM 2522]